MKSQLDQMQVLLHALLSLFLFSRLVHLKIKCHFFLLNNGFVYARSRALLVLVSTRKRNADAGIDEREISSVYLPFVSICRVSSELSFLLPCVVAEKTWSIELNSYSVPSYSSARIVELVRLVSLPQVWENAHCSHTST